MTDVDEASEAINPPVSVRIRVRTGKSAGVIHAGEWFRTDGERAWFRCKAPAPLRAPDRCEIEVEHFPSLRGSIESHRIESEGVEVIAVVLDDDKA